MANLGSFGFLLKLRDKKRILIFLIAFAAITSFFIINNNNPNRFWLTDNLVVVIPAFHSNSSPQIIESIQNRQSPSFVSYCSLEADKRGPHQNVIAFSLYGDFSNSTYATRYLDPFKMTIQNISQVYPSK